MSDGLDKTSIVGVWMLICNFHIAGVIESMEWDVWIGIGEIIYRSFDDLSVKNVDGYDMNGYIVSFDSENNCVCDDSKCQFNGLDIKVFISDWNDL